MVVALLEAPLVDPDIRSGSPCYRKPLDVLLGMNVSCGAERAFMVIHADRRRFQLYEPRALPPPPDA